jgi:Domain of unknown function (DUF5047)
MVTEAFRAALRYSHRIATRVDAYHGSTLVLADVPFSAGSVSIDGSSDVRRSLSLSVADPALAPTDESSVLTPFAAELKVYRGITYPDGTQELAPLGVFRVDSVSVRNGGAVEVSGPDRSRQIADARFMAAQQSRTTNRVTAEIARLVAEVDAAWSPLAVSIPQTGYTPAVTWEEDRRAAIGDLAASVGAEFYFNADGDPVLAAIPAVTDPVAWWVDAGESGVLIDHEQATTRERTYNAVVARGERTDNTPPVRATAYDTDTASPTRWGGPFGKVPRFYASPLLTTTTQAAAAARAILDRTRALHRQLRLSAVPNPALDAGDVIAVRFPDGRYERHVIDKLTIPLGVADAMSIETRSTTPEYE